MADVIVFDTHRFVRNLTAHGFTEEQAEALANEQVQLLNTNLATKADIDTLRVDLATVKADLDAKIETIKADLDVKVETIRADLDAKVETIRADLELKIEKAKVDLLKWLFGALVAQGGLIVALVKLL